MPESTSSNIMLGVGSRPKVATSMAKLMRANSPPEATLRKARAGCPGLADTKNSQRSKPYAVGLSDSLGLNCTLNVPPDIPSSAMKPVTERASDWAESVRCWLNSVAIDNQDAWVSCKDCCRLITRVLTWLKSSACCSMSCALFCNCSMGTRCLRESSCQCAIWPSSCWLSCSSSSICCCQCSSCPLASLI